MPEGTVMGHIHLHVSELVKTEEFYVNGLGFDVVIDMARQALFLSNGKYHHHIGVNIWNGVGASKPLENSVGLKSFTLILPMRKSAKKRSNLQKIGAKVTKENNPFITHDPSGNTIELAV